MTQALKAWLEKATLTTGDFTGGSKGGYLSPQQVKTFLRLVMDSSVLVSDMRQEASISPVFEVPRISLNDRILRPGVQAERLADGSRVKPATGLVTLTTQLFKGEVLVSDETFEDQVEQEGFADTLATMIAEAVGRDVEEIAIKSDTDRTGGDDATLDLFDGIIKTYQDKLPGGQIVDASGYTEAIPLLDKMITTLPAKYRRNQSSLVIYCSQDLADAYQAELGTRVTVLGDQNTTDDTRQNLRRRGVKVIAVPLLSGSDTIDGDAVDYGSFAWLTWPKNTIIGWHRKVRIEKFRDPREGATSFLPSVRFDVKHADDNFAVLAEGVPSLAGS